MDVELAIRGGVVWGPHGGESADVYASDGRIVRVGGPHLEAKTELDADGLWVMPGVVDGHIHIPDPDHAEREDFPSGTAAAASNGTTFLLEHHHSAPVRNAAALREKSTYLATRSLVDFGLIGVVHPGNLDELPDLWEAGAYAFKLFTCELHGAPAVTGATLRRALSIVSSFDGLVLAHCEDDAMVKEAETRLRAAGRRDPAALLEWRTLAAELAAVEELGDALQASGARAVLAHASHPEVIERATEARDAGARLAVETCPHYLWLTDDAVRDRGPWAKCTPPPREAAAREGLRRLVAERRVDLISADHAPTTVTEKEAGEDDIWECPFGLPGAETTLSAMLTGVSEGWLSMPTVVSLMCEGPARTYGIHPRKGSLAPDSDADIVLVDPQASREVRREDVRSRAGWSAFEGRQLVGAAVRTFVRGQTVWSDGEVLAPVGHGRYIPR